MRIEFYRDDGTIISDTGRSIFVMDGEVYSDNGYSTESQSAQVRFEDFIERLPDVKWRVVT